MVIPKSILEKLEPEATNISSGNPLLISIAISMKRIADVACELDYVDEETNRVISSANTEFEAVALELSKRIEEIANTVSDSE